MLVDVTLIIQLDVSKHLQKVGCFQRDWTNEPKSDFSDIMQESLMSLSVITYLHSNNSIYEEKHCDKKTDIRKSLLGRREWITTCQKGKEFVLFSEKTSSICERLKMVQQGSRLRGIWPWRIVQTSTVKYEWCNPASAAWSIWRLGKASGNSCWWCSPTGIDTQIRREGERERRESDRQKGETDYKTQMVGFITTWLKLCPEAGM